MGETRIRLDPAGYQRAVEEGISMSFTGEELYQKMVSDKSVIFPGHVFAPQGSGWLCCQPRQFNPLWYADSRLVDHVLHKDLWTFAAGMTIDDYRPPHKIGGPDYPADRWFSFWVPPGTTPVFSVDWGAAAAACKINLPPNMKALAFCANTPPSVGLSLADDAAAYFTPFLQFVHYPAPDNCVAFGWSHFMVILFGDTGYLLRSPHNDKAGWEQLGSWSGGDYKSLIEIQKGGDYFFTEENVRALVRSVLAMEVGDTSMYLYRTQGPPTVVQTRKPPALGEAGDTLPGGAWWIAAPEGQKVLGQVQITGYEVAGQGVLRPLTFQLGAGFAPTRTPDFRPVFRIHRSPSGPPPGYTEDSVAEGARITADATGEQLIYDLQDEETGDPWISDGVIHKGSFYVELHPSTAPGKPGGYLAPQVKLVEIVFPALLTDRHHRELILADTEFDSWDIEASYYRPEDSTISVFLREEQALLLEDAGLHQRANYPLLIEENVATFGPPLWTTRAAGWVEAAELEETKVENDLLGDDGLKLWRLKARGLLSRADRRWRIVPEIIDPDGHGYVEHTFAVRKALTMAHFDVTDPDAVYIHPDPHAGTARARLPGTWAQAPAKPGVKTKNAHGPTRTETKLAYCRRLAVEWADWAFYTSLNGKVWYHPNLPTWLATGEEQYWYAVSLFKSAADAVAAGWDARQVYWETDAHTVEPRANVWTVYGIDDDDLSRAFCVVAPETLTDIDDPNFVGEDIPYLAKPRLAIHEDACRNLALIGLRRSKQRKRLRRFGTRLAPWDIQGDPNGLDVGVGFTAQDRGRYLAVHIRCRLVHRDVYETVVTSEEVPAGTLTGAAAGTYPGQGLEG